jgi:hypothetical protein
MEPSAQESIVRALRRLTIAVWALTAVFAVFVGMYLVAYIPTLSITSSSPREPQPPGGAAVPSRPTVQHENFHELPLEKKIEAASVIAIAKYQKEGDRNKCIISEILRQVPDTKFYYKVGDEFRQCSHYLKPGEDRGDGQLMFFVGNPAGFRYSSSFRGERLPGLGDMPFDLLRKEIKEAK